MLHPTPADVGISSFLDGSPASSEHEATCGEGSIDARKDDF